MVPVLGVRFERFAAGLAVEGSESGRGGRLEGLLGQHPLPEPLGGHMGQLRHLVAGRAESGQVAVHTRPTGRGDVTTGKQAL